MDKETLLQAFAVLYNPELSNEQREIANKALMENYNNPEAIMGLFESYDTPTNHTIHFAAALGISTVITRFWEKVYFPSTQKGLIENKLMSILNSESDPIISRSIGNCFSVIFESDFSDGQNLFPEIFPFLQSLFERGKIEIATILLSILLPYLGASMTNYLPLAKDIIQSAFQQTCTNFEFRIASAQLLYTILKCASSESGDDQPTQFDVYQLNPLFHRLLEILVEYLHMGPSTKFISFINPVESCCSCSATYHLFDQPLDLLSIFMKIGSDPTLPPGTRPLLFDSISTIISNSGDITDMLPDLIVFIMKSAIEAFDTEICFVDQRDLQMCTSSFKSLFDMCDTESLLENIKGYFETCKTQEGAVIATATSILDIIQEDPSLIISQFPFLRDFAMNCISQMSSHSICEAGFNIFSTIFTRQSDSLHSIVGPILEASFGAIQSGHESLILAALETLAQLYSAVPIATKFVIPSFQKLQEAITGLSSQPHLQTTAIYTVSTFIQSAYDDLQLVMSPLHEMAINATSSTDGSGLLVSAGIECLGAIIRYAEELSPEIVSHDIDIILSNASTDDLILRTSCFNALSFAVKRANRDQKFINIVGRTLNPIIELVMFVCTEAKPLLDSEECEDNSINNQIIDMQNAALELITTVAKVQPFHEGLMQWLKPIYEKIKEFKEKSPLEIGKASIIALGMLAITAFQYGSFELLNDLEQEFLDDIDDVNLAEGAFKCMSNIVEIGASFSEELKSLIANKIGAYFELATFFLDRKCGCLIENPNYPIDLGSNVYILLRCIIQYFPQFFKIEKVLNRKYPVFKDDANPYETAEMIEVLFRYFATLMPPDSIVYRKTIVEFFINCFSHVNFEEPPNSIYAIRLVADLYPKESLLTKNLSEIFAKIDELLEYETQGEQYYYQAISYTVSLLLTLFKQGLRPLNELQNYLPRIFAALPPMTHDEVDNIYQCLIELCTREGENIMQPFMNEVMRVLVVTFGMPDNDFKEYEFSPHVIQMCFILMKNMFNALDEQTVKQILESLLDNEEDRITLQTRMDKVLSSLQQKS